MENKQIAEKLKDKLYWPTWGCYTEFGELILTALNEATAEKDKQIAELEGENYDRMVIYNELEDQDHDNLETMGFERSHFVSKLGSSVSILAKKGASDV